MSLPLGITQSGQQNLCDVGDKHGTVEGSFTLAAAMMPFIPLASGDDQSRAVSEADAGWHPLTPQTAVIQASHGGQCAAFVAVPFVFQAVYAS